jgi:hypothetical protein
MGGTENMSVHIDTGRAFLIIGLTLLGVILINVVIYYLAKGKGTIEQIDLFRKASHRIRNPWGIEDQNLRDLSEIVEQFKQKQENPSTEGEIEENKGNG